MDLLAVTPERVAALTKAELLNDLRSARAEWDDLIAQVDPTNMTLAGVAGYWSVKDIVGHLTAVDRWHLNAFRAHDRGEPPPAIDEQLMELDERNRAHYEANRQRPLEEVFQESRRVFQELLTEVEGQSEEFLTQPQVFDKLPAPVVVAENLKQACANHYRHHLPDVRAWLRK